jgi:hypothetical protein
MSIRGCDAPKFLGASPTALIIAVCVLVNGFSFAEILAQRQASNLAAFFRTASGIFGVPDTPLGPLRNELSVSRFRWESTGTGRCN